MAIQVLCDSNGKRIGYRAADDVLGLVNIPILGSLTIGELTLHKRNGGFPILAQPEPPRPALLDYALLPRGFGDCPHCGYYISWHFHELLETTAGLQDVATCPSCNKKSR